ncbi:glypican-1-like isoform X2 [Gopherus flavomarginatus]|uniref:glypican-1-like isoform X2 n=1 Tax=Gopherus flavomarginatus TaxID=286002 RepID=UPI0021CBA783|nr:glypican-1-like isoform X2 [Gopherus flavomarginatus]
MQFFPWGFWLLCVAASPARGDSGSKAKSCTEVRQFYATKGFSLHGVPQAEISGEHLRICPQGYTCCTSEMEENFAKKSQSEFEDMMTEASRSAQVTLTSQYKNFDDICDLHLESMTTDCGVCRCMALTGMFCL